MPQTKRTASGVLGGLLGLVGLSVVAAILVTAAVTPAIAVSGAVATSALTMFDKLPATLDIEKLMVPSTMLAKNPDTGKYDVVLTQFYDQNRSPVTFDEVAPVMYDAMLSSEDKNFYKHGGVDLFGTLAAVWDNIRQTSSRGGSSISQQYVKNVLVQNCAAIARTEDENLQCYTDATQSDGAEGVQRKVQEMRYAVALEDKYSKNEILLGYLNIAAFGGLQYGVDAASRYYFGIPASQLSLAQAATLAGMVQEPNRYRIDQPEGSTVDDDGNLINNAADGYAATKDRRDYVLWRMLDDGKISQEQYDAALAEPITPVITPAKTGCAAATNAEYFCQYVKGVILNDPAFGENVTERAQTLRRGGLEIETTLDLRLQNEATATMHDIAPSWVEGIDFGAAAVNREVATGRVLSMTQNTNFSEDLAVTSADPSYSSLVYAANYDTGGSTGFEAGSTFKLFTLVDWLEQGRSVNEVLNGTIGGTYGRYYNGCLDEAYYLSPSQQIGNNDNVRGSTASVMRFTAQSLNSGYLAMAKQLDMCDIAKVAGRMGVKTGDGRDIAMNAPFSILGSDNVDPLSMAGAYATIANNGTFCQPKAIDRVIDSEGRDLTPKTQCEQVIEPNVAATTAWALEGVMNGGGTGTAANAYDGVPVIGKTGTHETYQTWMIQSSTAVTTAVWVGTTQNQGDLPYRWHNDRELNRLRFDISARMQSMANNLYGGGAFAEPDDNLTRVVMRDLPNVVGMSIEDAEAELWDAGFDSEVGDPVDSGEPAGTVAEQSPSGDRAPAGATITLRPSNGQGGTVPDVSGRSLDDALAALRSAGFGDVKPGKCTASGSGGNTRTATGTNPAAGTGANRNTAVTVDYTSERC